MSNIEFFATAGSIPVHIQDSKRGEKCIILLHGYLETLYIWNDLCEKLESEYRVIAIDLPGHGLSCSAPVNTMGFLATVVKGVLDVCGVEKAIIGGHSLGGYAAFECCRMFPETFTGLVLFNSHPYADPEEKTVDRNREINLIGEGKLALLADISIPKMYCQANLRSCDDKIRETVELCETHDPDGIIASLKGMGQRPSSEEFMKNPPIPVLAILGDHDGFIPMEMVEKMKADFPAVKYVVLENTGHNAFIESPAKALEALLNFTKENC